MMEIFSDSYIHLGGDEVELTCQANLTQLLQFENITASDLPLYYRQRQKQIIRKTHPSRQRIYWENNLDNINSFESGDVIHWWGDTRLPNTTNKIIISTYNPLYLDLGVGNYFGMPYGLFSNWLNLYDFNIQSLISNYTNRNNVLGGEVLLWS